MRFQEQDEGDSNVVNHHFVKQALQPLLKLLLQQLLKQEEDQDKDDTLWNVSMAAGTCIGLIAATVGDDIIPDVMAFVQVFEPPLGDQTISRSGTSLDLTCF